jgi:hypothetical protein
VHGVTELLGPFGDPAPTRYQTAPAQVFATRSSRSEFDASVAGKTSESRGPRLRDLPRRVLSQSSGVFVFFYNRLGCLGSLLVSAVGTLLLLFLFGVLD